VAPTLLPTSVVVTEAGAAAYDQLPVTKCTAMVSVPTAVPVTKKRKMLALSAFRTGACAGSTFSEWPLFTTNVTSSPVTDAASMLVPAGPAGNNTST